MDENNSIQNENITQEYHYAAFWIRVWATMIDFFVFIPIIILLFVNMLVLRNIYLMFLLYILYFLYKPLMESRYGATLGKMACKIRVINENGEFISIYKSFIRNSIYLISIILTFLLSYTIYNMPGFEDLTFKTLGEFQKQSVFQLPDTIFSYVYLIDCLIVVFNSKKRALHDFIGNTYCVYE